MCVCVCEQSIFSFQECRGGVLPILNYEYILNCLIYAFLPYSPHNLLRFFVDTNITLETFSSSPFFLVFIIFFLKILNRIQLLFPLFFYYFSEKKRIILNNRYGSRKAQMISHHILFFPFYTSGSTTGGPNSYLVSNFMGRQIGL